MSLRPSSFSMLAVRGALACSLLVAATALAACGSGDDDGGPGEPLVAQVSGEPEETAIYEAIAAAYNAQEPDRAVEIVAVARKDDHLALLQTSFAAGQAPEVYLINYREYASFVERGAVAPVGDLLAERGVDLADYYPAPVEAFTRDGELQCMPQNASSLVVYVNTALFAQRGVDLPFAGWTFEEFRAAAQRLTFDHVDGVYVEPSLIRLAPFAWSLGGEIVDDPTKPTGLTLNDPTTRSALEALIDLQRVDRVMPTEEELVSQDAESRFVTGKLAMILSSRKSTPYFRENPDLQFDVLPMPRMGEPVSILHSDAYCLSSADDDAADFIAYATGSEGQRIAALGGRTVPSLRAVAESGAFLNPTRAPAHSEVFIDALEGMRAVPVVENWPQIEDLAEEYLTRLWYDTDAVEPGDVDAVLSELDARTRELF